MLLCVKEFLNLKPLILLLGISKVQDLTTAKKLITCLSANCVKGSLIEKLANLLKTHLDFMSWMQQIKNENRKKEVTFSELLKLLHRQLPLNIISQLVDITKVDNAEMTKILRNTLTDKGKPIKP